MDCSGSGKPNIYPGMLGFVFEFSNALLCLATQIILIIAIKIHYACRR